MTMGERIKKVRRFNDLTQREFGERISIKQNSVAQIEMGRNTSDQTISAICKEFNVSEEWLRTGAGEMFLQISKEDELASAVNKLLTGETSEFKRRLIKILADLKPQQWEILEGYALQLVQDKPGPDKTLEQKADEFAAMAREQFLTEQEQAAQALSANESDAG